MNLLLLLILFYNCICVFLKRNTFFRAILIADRIPLRTVFIAVPTPVVVSSVREWLNKDMSVAIFVDVCIV